jgi:hypothetical protein
MRATSGRSQRALQWAADDDLRWDEVPTSLQAEVRALLRHLLLAAAGEARAEADHDQ